MESVAKEIAGGARGNGSVARKKKTEKIVFLLPVLEDSDAPLGSEVRIWEDEF